MDRRGLGGLYSCRCRLASLFPARAIRVGDALFDWLSGMGKWIQVQAAKVKV